MNNLYCFFSQKVCCRSAVAFMSYGIVALLALSCNKNQDAATEQIIKEKVVDRIKNGYSVGTVVVFFHDGKEEYFTYGFSDSTHRQPITKKSVFEIGSISKTFTSLLVADLILKGKVKLDDPIEIHLPDSLKIPSFKGARITFADLATHTSGLPRMPELADPKDENNAFADYTDEKLYAFLGSYNLTHAKGKFEYSNLGVGLLGNAAARISGKTYEHLLQDVICKPLGMHETSTLNSSPYLTAPHVGTMPASHTDLGAITGAGGIRSSAEDMLRYIKLEMGLIPSSLLPAMKLTQHPLRDAGKNMKIGMGWHLVPNNGDTIVWHSGATTGYRTFVGFSLNSKRAIIILNNSAKTTDDLGMYYFDQNTKIESLKIPVAMPLEQLKDKIGVYKITTVNDAIKPGSQIQIRLDGDHLAGRLAAGPWISLFAESESQFFTAMDHSISFSRSPEGRIHIIRVHFPFGLEISATRQNSKFPLLR